MNQLENELLDLKIDDILDECSASDLQKIFEDRIECLRKEMYKIAKLYGFTDERAVQISKKLDKVLNLYKKLFEKA